MSLASQRAIVLRGDPGLFDIVKKGLGIASRFVPGGGAVRTAVGITSRFVGQQAPRFPVALPASPFAGPMRPGGVPSPSVAVGPSLVGAMAGGCPKGFHPNRSSYHTSQGFVERGSRCVRNRRRNLSNGRANTRALRRMAAWEKQDKKRRTTLKAIARSAG